MVVDQVSERELTRADQFLLLASAGLWHVMTSQQAVDHVRPLRPLLANALRRVLQPVCVSATSEKRQVTSDVSRRRRACGNIQVRRMLVEWPSRLDDVAVKAIAGMLCDLALDLGAARSVTVVLVVFKDVTKLGLRDLFIEKKAIVPTSSSPCPDAPPLDL